MKRWKLILGSAILIVVVACAASPFFFSYFYSEDAETAWTYRSPTHGFSVQLPSGDWKEFKRDDSAAAFVNQKHRAFFTVKISKDADAGSFTKIVQEMRDLLESERASLREKPAFSEGKTDAGHPFAYFLAVSEADQANDVVVAKSAVWCKEKGIIVTVLLEGNLLMASQTGKAQERAYYERICKMICLSPR